jgi:hypothetical protein
MCANAVKCRNITDPREVLRIFIILIRIRLVSWNFDAEPDQTFHFDMDPDTAFYFNADPDPAPRNPQRLHF